MMLSMKEKLDQLIEHHGIETVQTSGANITNSPNNQPTLSPQIQTQTETKLLTPSQTCITEETEEISEPTGKENTISQTESEADIDTNVHKSDLTSNGDLGNFDSDKGNNRLPSKRNPPASSSDSLDDLSLYCDLELESNKSKVVHCASCSCHSRKQSPKLSFHYLDKDTASTCINLSSNGLKSHDNETAV